MHLPLSLVKAREGGLLHVSSCQLTSLEVYVHLGETAEESLVLSDWFACLKWHTSSQRQDQAPTLSRAKTVPLTLWGLVIQGYKSCPKLGEVELDL